MNLDLLTRPDLSSLKTAGYAEAVFVVGSGAMTDYAGVFQLARRLARQVYVTDDSALRPISAAQMGWMRLCGSFSKNVLSLRTWTDRVRRLRWWAARSLTPRQSVHSRGLRFTLQCDNTMTHGRWASFNTKEPETLDWIDRHLKNGDTFFDVGANIGVFTLYAALRCPGARIVAFEPEYANLHFLRDNVIENRLQDRVDVYSIALGDRTGLSRLHIQDSTPGSAMHTESPVALTATRTRRPVIWREGIAAMTLDSFCDQSGLSPQCMKIDVDGTELEILDGAKRVLMAGSLRSILIEITLGSGIDESCGRILTGSGFQCEWRDPSGRIWNQIWTRK